jgi:hypothetical protein
MIQRPIFKFMGLVLDVGLSKDNGQSQRHVFIRPTSFRHHSRGNSNKLLLIIAAGEDDRHRCAQKNVAEMISGSKELAHAVARAI